jgi:hypothetical protein
VRTEGAEWRALPIPSVAELWPNMKADSGSRWHDAKATIGVAASLLALLQDTAEEVTHIAVAFDNPIRSFRNDLFDFYKSDEGVPPELHAQFDPVEEAVRAIGVTVWSMKEHEADDGLATGARIYADQVEQVRIMTPDKDLGQCISGERVVQVDRRQRKRRVRADAQRHLRAPGEHAEAARVLGHDRQRGVPRHRGEPLDRELARAEREREREQVVEPRVGVDVDAPRAQRFAP